MSQAQTDETGGLTRRRYMQLVGAGAVAAGVGASSDEIGMVGEAEALPDGVTLGLAAASPVGFGAGYAGWELAEYLSKPTNNETALHQACMTAKEWWDSYYVVADNYLEDTATIASIEARDAIASTWEDGGSSSEAAGAAIDNIYGYYDTRLENTIETARAVLTQIGLQSHTARNSGQFDDSFVTAGTASGEYSGSGSYNTSFIDIKDGDGTESTVELPSGETIELTMAESTIELTDGDEYTTTMPEFVSEYDNGDELRTPIDEEWISNYDAQAGTTMVATADGNELTADFSVGIHNVPETGLPSETVFESVADFIDLVHRIRDQASTVATNYELSFIEDLYAELNQGNITPQDVRGVEGTARFLSGTDDVHSSRFRMALASQLGVEQPDLSNTASMSIEYSGATSYSVNNPADGQRGRYPSEIVDDQAYTGMLFGSDVPGIISGGRYAVAPLLYVTGSDGFYAIDAQSGEVMWSHDEGTQHDDATVSSDGSTVYVAASDGVQAIDIETGESAWSTAVGNVNKILVSPDGAAIYASDADGAIHALDADDGGSLWTHSASTQQVKAMAVSPDGSRIYSGTVDGVYAADSDGNGLSWSYTGHSDTVYSVAVSPDGSSVYSGDYVGEIHATSAEDGSSQWTYTGGHSSNVHALDVSRDGSVLFSGSRDNKVDAIDTESVSSQWTYSEYGDNVKDLDLSPGGSMIYSSCEDGSVHALAAESGDAEWTNSSYGSDWLSAVAVMQPTEPVDGVVHGAYFFDGGSGDELQLSNGIMEVTSMQGSDGEAVEVASGETISYIEDADGRSIEEILKQIPEIDSVDDVHSLSDLELIVAEADGVESVDELPIDAQEWTAPDYNSYNADEYVEYIQQVTEDYQDALENQGGGGGGGSWGGPDWDWWQDLIPDFLPDRIMGFPTWLVIVTGGLILLVTQR